MTDVHESGFQCAQCELNASGYVRVPGTLDPIEQKCIDDIAEYGCEVQLVHGGSTWLRSPVRYGNFGYSVGLFDRFDHPEIVVFGQRPEWQHRIINCVKDDVAGGRTFTHGQLCNEYLEGFNVAFVDVPVAAHAEFFGWALWYYRQVKPAKQDFRFRQLVWPDLSGRFPWEKGYYNEYPQPVLGCYHWNRGFFGLRATPIRGWKLTEHE